MARRARHRSRRAMSALRHELGLDRPLLEQFGIYLWRLLHGDFGISIVTQRAGADRVHDAVPGDLELSLCAMLFAVVLGLPAGVVAAVQARNSLFDHGVMGVVARRLFDADLLVGPAPHPVLLGATRLDAGLGPHRPAVLLRAGHRLHADRQRCSPTSRAPSARRSRISSCRPSCSAPCRSRSSPA